MCIWSSSFFFFSTFPTLMERLSAARYINETRSCTDLVGLLAEILSGSSLSSSSICKWISCWVNVDDRRIRAGNGSCWSDLRSGKSILERGWNFYELLNRCALNIIPICWLSELLSRLRLNSFFKTNVVIIFLCRCLL